MAIPNTKYDPLTKGSAIKQAARNPAVSMADNPLAQLRHFSGGGTVAETPEQLMARMAAKYGAPKATPESPQSPPPSQPPAQPPVNPPPKPQGIGGVIGIIQGRKEQLDKAINGYANGGKIKGPGSPTSDSIPAQVQQTGEPIAVSTDERILSKAQDAALEQLAMAQGFESLDAMLEAMTGQPVGPTISAEGKKAATGMAPEQNPLTANAPYAMGSAADPHAVTAQSANPLYTPGGANDPHASFATAPARPSAAPASPIAATPRQTPNMMMPIDTLFPEKRFFATGGSLDNDEITRKVMVERFRAAHPNSADITNKPLTNPLPAVAAPTGMPSDRQTDPKRRSVIDGGFTGRMYDQSGINRERAAAYKNLPVAEGPATGEAVPNLASFPKPSAPGVNPLPQAIQPGMQERTFGANAAASPIATPTSPNAVSAPQAQQPGAANPAEGQKQTSFTEIGKNPLTLSGPLDAHGNSMAATNEMKAQLAEMTRTAPANVVMLENSGLKDTQELMDKWGRQDMQREMLQEMSRNPRAANAIAGLAANANNTEAQLRGQDFAAQANQRNTATTQRGQDLAAETARRGQDVNAATDANRLAGNPLDNDLKRLQVQTGQMALDRAKANEAAIEEIQAEKDPAKRQSMIEALLAAQGTNPNAGRYIKVDGGEYTDAMGNKLKAPSGIYDAATEQFKPMNNAGGARSFTQADVDAAIKGGADKAKVAERIESMGGNPKDYGL